MRTQQKGRSTQFRQGLVMLLPILLCGSLTAADLDLALVVDGARGHALTTWFDPVREEYLRTLHVVDIRDPRQMRRLGGRDIAETRRLAVCGRYAYVGGSPSAL